MKNAIHFVISFDLTEKPTNHQGFKIMEHNQQSLAGAGELELTAALNNAKEVVKNIICKNLNTYDAGVLAEVENYKTLKAVMEIEGSGILMTNEERAKVVNDIDDILGDWTNSGDDFYLQQAIAAIRAAVEKESGAE